MPAPVYDFLGAVTAIAQVVVVIFLLLGPFRKFPFLFVYVAVDLANNAALTWANMLYGGSRPATAATASEGQKLYTHLYWTGEVTLDLLLFLLVIVLIYKTTSEGPLRGAIGKLLGVVVVLALILPFVLFHPTFSPWPKGTWFNSTSQLLNFGGAILNLALWTALIASKQRDPRFLTVSAGLGIIVTGAAISFGLRHFIASDSGLRWMPDLFLVLTRLSGVALWCWALRPVSAASRPQTDALNPL